MAKNSAKVENRTSPVDVGGSNAEGVISAWDGLYWAFGARAEGFDVLPDGLVIRGLTFDGQYDTDTLIADVNHKGRRVQLFPTINWINGQEPAPFTDAKEMTAFMVQHFRGAVEGDNTRTPEYVRKAFSTLKSTLGISNKRGPKPKTISLKNLGTIDASTFRNAKVSSEDLEALIAVAKEVIASQAAVEVTA